MEKLKLSHAFEKNKNIITNSWIHRNKKILFAKYLIELQKTEGLEYYYKWSKENNKAYINRAIYEGINKSLSKISDIGLIDYLIKFMELTFVEGFKDSTFDGVYQNVRKAIINIGLQNQNNFKMVKTKLEKMIIKNTKYENIGFVYYIIEDMERGYYQNSVSDSKLLDIKKKIKELEDAYNKKELENWI